MRCNCLVPGGIETDLLKSRDIRMANEQGITFDEWEAKGARRRAAAHDLAAEVDRQPGLVYGGTETRTLTVQSINCGAGEIMIG